MFSRIYLNARWLILCISTVAICVSCTIFATIHFGQSESRRELTHDAGYVRAGHVVKHEFAIVNKSRKPLHILDIKASCACVLPKDIGRDIKPKSTYKLPLSVDTGGRSGAYSAVVLVRLDNERDIRCVLDYHVVTGHPKELLFPDTMRGEDIKREFYLENIAEEKITIKDITYSQKYFDVAWNAHAMDDERISAHKISVTLKGTLPYGPFDEWITIETDDSLEPRKRVNLRGYVRQPIECDKTRLALGIIKGNSRKTAKVRVFSPYNMPFEIVKVENAKGDHCTWHLEKVDDTNYELQIVIDGKDYEERSVISEEISIYGLAEETHVRQDIHVFALFEI